MFKLLNSSGITESGESEKVLLLMESGVRLHTTAYVRLGKKKKNHLFNLYFKVFLGKQP